jgi:hypothetical protein
MGAQPGTWSIREASTTGGSVFLQRGAKTGGSQSPLGVRGVPRRFGDGRRLHCSRGDSGTSWGLHRNTIGDFFIFELQ